MYFFDLDKFHFNCDGYYNGKQSWLSDDTQIKIIWDTTLTPNCWRFSSTTYNLFDTVININPASPPINGNWTWVGREYEITATQGECSDNEELTMIVVKNNPSCECDANITLYGEGGQPPYQYSFDNGVTYGNSPFKDGLCGDLSLTVKIKDSEGTIFSKLVEIPALIESVNYVIKLTEISSTVITVNNPRVEEFKYSVTVTPPLPNGVSINFNLNLGGTFVKSPYSNSATSSFNPQVKKNGVVITNYTDNTATTTTTNTSPSCQEFQLYTTEYEYNYTNLSYTNSDTYEITVIPTYQLTCSNPAPSTLSLGPLSFQQSNTALNCCNAYFSTTNKYSLTGLNIEGCICCSVSNWEYFYTRS
jgi:hypothetical protein